MRTPAYHDKESIALGKGMAIEKHDSAKYWAISLIRSFASVRVALMSLGSDLARRIPYATNKLRPAQSAWVIARPLSLEHWSPWGIQFVVPRRVVLGWTFDSDILSLILQVNHLSLPGAPPHFPSILWMFNPGLLARMLLRSHLGRCRQTHRRSCSLSSPSSPNSLPEIHWLSFLPHHFSSQSGWFWCSSVNQLLDDAEQW